MYLLKKSFEREREREGFVALGAFDLQHEESNIRYNCDSLSLSPNLIPHFEGTL